jgi:hypothetical protein
VTAPAPTVTETAEAEEVTPQSCLDALDYADKGFDAAGDLAGVVIEAFQAISDYDDAGIRKATKKLDKINDRIGTPSTPTPTHETSAAAMAKTNLTLGGAVRLLLIITVGFRS